MNDMQQNNGVPCAPGGQCAERTAGGADGAAPRLDKRTYLYRKETEYRVLLRDYGAGLAEIGWSFLTNRKAKKAGRGQSANQEVNQDRAARRAKSSLRQLILSAGCDHLLTLTYRENLTDFKLSSRHLTQFLRKVKARFSEWVYVAVPEKQKRGAWHWHIAVIGRQDVTFLRECWLSVVVEGNIDVQPPPRGKKNRRMAIVAYLSKYLAKGLDEGHLELNGHRYRASLGIVIPCEVIKVPLEDRENVANFITDCLRERAGDVSFAWVDSSGMAGWACCFK